MCFDAVIVFVLPSGVFRVELRHYSAVRSSCGVLRYLTAPCGTVRCRTVSYGGVRSQNLPYITVDYGAWSVRRPLCRAVFARS